jgi:hypothetical protein
VSAQIIKREEKRRNNDKCQMPYDKKRMNSQRVGNKAHRKDMEGIKEVEEEEVKNGQNAMFFSIIRKHKTRKKN